MLTVSDELKNAFMKSERTIYVRIKIGNRTFDNDNVVSVEYDSGSLSGEVFAIGSTYSNSIKITFSELVEDLKELDEVSYEIGIKLSSGAIEYVPMGIFIINDAIGMDRNNNKTTIECMDRMIMMGGTYVSSLTYPAAIREVALEIANKSGLVVDSTSFERLSADKIAKPEGYNYREAIGLIAQVEAGFATFNRYGKLEIRTLSDPNFAIPPDNYFSKGLVKNEVFFRLGGISCVTDYSDATIQSGNTAGNQVVLENRIMTKMLLDKIYQKIQTINYYPFSLNWQGNPVLEAGDWVVVEDLEGNKFKTPNLSYSLSFNGGLSAKSSAETTTQSDVTYQYKSPLRQKIEWIYAQIDAAGGNLIYEGIDEPSNPKEGDLWFKIIGPDKQILIFKKKADGTLFWEPQISTADINRVAEEVNNIIDQADLDRTKAEQEISQALTDAKNYTEVKAKEFDNQLLIVNQNLTTAKDLANAAVTKADKAIADVGFIKPDVAAAKANAATAIQDAATATQNATTAIQNAQTALNSITTLSQEVDVSITNINGELTRKVSQTTFNTLSGTVGTHTTQIGQTQNALLAKAESSLVNTIKGTVDTHTTQIKVVSDGLELKAESSLVNTVKGTVDSHSSLISANSQAISARLTSAQIETLLTGKQYINQTTLAATSNGLTAQITQVSTDLSNLEIGGRNYYTNSVPIVTNDVSAYLRNTTETPYGFQVTGGSSNAGYVRLDDILTGRGFWTVSFDLKGTQNTAVPITINIAGVDSKLLRTTNNNTWSRVSFTANVTNDNLYILFERIGWAYFRIRNIKVEKGSKATDFTPPPEDMATLEKVVTIEANIDGINTLVATKASQSQVTQLAGQITTKVESATYTSKMTQLDSAINLRVVQADVTAAILADKTIKDTRNENQLPSWYNQYYPRNKVEEFKQRATMGVPGSATYGQLTTTVPWASSSGGAITQNFSSSDGVFQRISNAAYTAWLPWDKIAESGKLISQINISTEGLLLQGKRIQLDGDVTMTSAFVTILDTKTLSAVTANIATIRSQVLIANVIDSTMVNANTALITKLFATDANVSVLTAKTAFINSVKAIDIAADRITAGTLNAANVNIINLNVSSLVGNISSFIQTNWNGLNTSISVNSSGLTSVSGALSTTLNAGSITTVSGTKTGTVNALGMQIADSSNGWTTRLYSDGLEFQWYGVIRGITQTSEGLEIKPTTGSGARLNSALALTTGPGNDKIAYLQLANPDGGTNSRLEMNGTQLSLRHPNGGSLDIADYAYNGQLGRINAGKFKTTTVDGRGIQMEVSQISALAGNQTIYIMPSGSGELRIGNGSANPTLWPIRASQFIQGSSRDSKTNINEYTGNALHELSQLRVVTYNRKDDLARGVDYLSLGFIAEDSPVIAVYNAGMPAGVDQYKMVSLAIKGVQELDQKVISIANIANASNILASRAFSEMQQLKNRVTELELKIKKMESAA